MNVNIIRKSREAMGLTKEQVCELLDIPLWVYEHYEQNIRDVELLHMIMLSELLEFEIKKQDIVSC